MTRITHIWFAVTGIILASLLTPPQARAIDYTNESLNYEIVFQWGLIWKHAASATLSIKKSGDGYHDQAPDKIFFVFSYPDKICQF